MVSPYDKSGNFEVKQQLAKLAVDQVENHTIVGIGSGSTMELFVELLAKRIATEKLDLQFVASSKKIEAKANAVGINFKEIDEFTYIDHAFDGADRVDGLGNLIKGGGGSLFRERQLLLMAKKKTILADESKFVSSFQNQIIPIEVVPFNVNFTMKQLEKIGLKVTKRNSVDGAFLTDNGNYIVDAFLLSHKNITNMYQEMKLMSGVV
ncbi:MAG: ribose 5-phosphate isomerase A, partial [Kurthia sp.]|nr:ribose 5-phosphate isomerase A [Candidatus Kurthia equi]